MNTTLSPSPQELVRTIYRYTDISSSVSTDRHSFLPEGQNVLNRVEAQPLPGIDDTLIVGIGA